MANRTITTVDLSWRLDVVVVRCVVYVDSEVTEVSRERLALRHELSEGSRVRVGFQNSVVAVSDVRVSDKEKHVGNW